MVVSRWCMTDWFNMTGWGWNSPVLMHHLLKVWLMPNVLWAKHGFPPPGGHDRKGRRGKHLYLCRALITCLPWQSNGNRQARMFRSWSWFARVHWVLVKIANEQNASHLELFRYSLSVSVPGYYHHYLGEAGKNGRYQKRFPQYSTEYRDSQFLFNDLP